MIPPASDDDDSDDDDDDTNEYNDDDDEDIDDVDDRRSTVDDDNDDDDRDADDDDDDDDDSQNNDGSSDRTVGIPLWHTVAHEPPKALHLTARQPTHPPSNTYTLREICNGSRRPPSQPDPPNHMITRSFGPCDVAIHTVGSPWTPLHRNSGFQKRWGGGVCPLRGVQLNSAGPLRAHAVFRVRR